MKNQTTTFSVTYKIIENHIKKALFILSLLLFSCSNDNEPNCDAELQEIETVRTQARINCNGSTTCISKINRDYEAKKQEVLNKCK